jgi:hypothetical protein
VPATGPSPFAAGVGVNDEPRSPTGRVLHDNDVRLLGKERVTSGVLRTSTALVQTSITAPPDPSVLRAGPICRGDRQVDRRCRHIVREVPLLPASTILLVA